MSDVDGTSTPSPSGESQSGTPLDTGTPSPAPETSSPDGLAPSSSAPQAETKETLLDHVLKSVPPQGEDPDRLTLPSEATPTSPGQPETPSSDEAEPTGPLPELTPEELARFSSRTRARIKQLVAERDTARGEGATLRADAEVAAGIRQYLASTEIQKEDFALLLDLGAALRKGDFQSFYAGVGSPTCDLAEEALGISIPPDLRQQVQQGNMTTEAARTFSRERMARQIAEGRAQHTTTQHQQIVGRAQQEALGNAVRDTVTNWEAQVKQVDPDYGHKQDLMKDMLWAVIRETGAPQNPNHALQIANEAYRRVNATVARFRPAPRATQASPSSVHRATGVTPEPKSLMEAAMLGLDRARRSA